MRLGHLGGTWQCWLRCCSSCLQEPLRFLSRLHRQRSLKKGDAFATFGKHASWVTIAVVALLFVLNRDYRTWRRWAPALVASAILFIASSICGRTSGGSKRWLDFGLFNVQPSELAKFALVIGVASFLDQRRYFLDRLDRVTVPISIWVAIVCGLIYIQRDLSTALIIGIIALGMMWAAGVLVKHLAPLIGVGVLLRVSLFSASLIAVQGSWLSLIPRTISKVLAGR